MSYHPCVSGCGRFLSPQDGHDRCLTCLGIQHAEGAFVDGSCSSCGDMTISELRDRLRYVKLGGVPLPRSGVRPGTRGAAASGGVRGDLRITVRASQEESLTPQALRSRWGCRWNGAGTSAERGTPPVSFGAPPDDQMSIAASEGELSLSGDDDSAALPPFGCGSVVRARPRDDGYAFPGRRECRARVESSTASRSFEAGRVVSRWGSRWFSAPPSGAILSGSAWGAYKIVEGTFHCPKQILWLLRPHHPWWWGCFGVHGHPLGGAVCGHATVSNSRYHPAGWSVSPLTGL